MESGRAWGNTIIKMDKFVTDDWEQTKSFAETGAFPKGIENMYIELNKFVNKQKLGRVSKKEKIFVGNVGISAADLVVGDIVYKTAMNRNIGIILPLMESENLLI